MRDGSTQDPALDPRADGEEVGEWGEWAVCHEAPKGYGVPPWQNSHSPPASRSGDPGSGHRENPLSQREIKRCYILLGAVAADSIECKDSQKTEWGAAGVGCDHVPCATSRRMAFAPGAARARAKIETWESS